MTTSTERHRPALDGGSLDGLAGEQTCLSWLCSEIDEGLAISGLAGLGAGDR